MPMRLERDQVVALHKQITAARVARRAQRVGVQQVKGYGAVVALNGFAPDPGE